ncbi:50S ribosomal protein L22 [Candidatus Kaiserbacteria bacterium RIFCSPHIGHO2_01_FULL_49_13]|uniref:Large ribosomal subunit protein uL22 n=1 Tax=Candidatus Kaiserbacteria bacterium RIFCSPHIGHO2_01_FULL_49_13 TaxID=1798477 RepID=A0A1F6CDH4_9BACT|nr:MAG: 50S ribosomal protein L22 [Candidatus Kaiserbacteria bacterium RIFCSPHIGHO2_01_FULL_49_13]
MRAMLKNYRQAPRKVRLVADAIRGKSVPRALTILSHMDKRAAGPIEKLLNSAIANAKQTGVEKENLKVVRVAVDKGLVFKKYMPRARGRAAEIKKRTSRITLELSSSGNQESGSVKRAESAK